MLNVLMRRVRLALSLMLLAMLPAPLAVADDGANMRSVVEEQLNAFAADRFDDAYAFAAPIVKQAFPTVEGFATMVQRGYAPVYRNTKRNFGETFTDQLGRPSLRVQLQGADGKLYEAIYALQQQEDGTWKIAGCVIRTIAAQEV